MLKRLLLLSFIIAFTCNFVFADGRLIPKAQYDKVVNMQYKVVMVGDALVGVKVGSTFNNVTVYPPTVISLITSPFTINLSESDFITSATFTPTSGQSIYDLQSNGVPVHIWQDPVTPDNIHAVYMTADYNDPVFTDRRSKYFFSSDRGVTWSFIGEVPTVRSGFVCITGLSNGHALVANHSAAGGDPVRAQVFADVYPGLGQFDRLDPGIEGHSPEPIWPRLVATSSITNTNKFVMVTSTQGDSTWYNVGTSLTTPGTFLGYSFYGGTSAENYSVARSQSGKIGLAYTNNNVLNPGNEDDVYFMESTDDGSTFSTPVKIFRADYSATGDSLGALRSVTLVYQYDNPKVAFSIIKQDPTAGSYFPLFPNKCMFWSTTLPGTDPDRSIVVANENNVWMPQDSLFQGVNDVYAPFDRPSIGLSADGNVLFYSIMVQSNRFGGIVDTTNCRNQYLTASGDGGATWLTPVQINPDVMDWTYASIAPWNDMDANNYYVNMTIQKDTIPGSFVNGGANGPSLAQQIFTRITISKDSIDVSVKNISNEIPGAYNLLQNYPNPFNPNTKIRFELPNASNVTLKVYNVRGQLVEVLVNNETVTAGLKEVDFNATNLASGIYFYTIQAGDFKATKKMMLLK